jgi:hypothetical protein
MISLGHRCEAQYILCRRDDALEPFFVEEMCSSLVECALEPTFRYNL